MIELIAETDIVLLNKNSEHVTWYTACVWKQPSGTVFGLREARGGYTHMSYFVDDIVNKQPILKRLDSTGQDKFYFDAGGNGRPLYCTRDELERVLRNLNLIGDDVETSSDSILGPDPEPINLDQYIQELRSNVDKFERWHKHNRDIYPEQFDDEMYSGEWEEHFVTWQEIGAPDAT